MAFTWAWKRLCSIKFPLLDEKKENWLVRLLVGIQFFFMLISFQCSCIFTELHYSILKNFIYSLKSNELVTSAIERCTTEIVNLEWSNFDLLSSNCAESLVIDRKICTFQPPMASPSEGELSPIVVAVAVSAAVAAVSAAPFFIGPRSNSSSRTG